MTQTTKHWADVATGDVRPVPRVFASRYHDICCGHRVVGHEGKCKHLHGHNYRFTFKCEAAALDSLGRVVDFSVIKATLCEWLEREWDHRCLIWSEDPWLFALKELDPSIVVVPFNPTAENIGLHLLNVVAPPLLAETGCTLVEVNVQETRKCAAVVAL